MHKKLKEIAGIVSGYTFRGSIKDEPKGDIFLVQAKNISATSDIQDKTDLTCVSSDGIRSPYFLEQNDIVLVSRGSGSGSFRSTVFASNKKNVMASSSVLVIRVSDVTILPKYISLYLNSPEGQKTLSQIAIGASYLQSILVKKILELEIPIPTMHTQKSIIALRENIIEQERIRERKQEIQEIIINASFTKLTKN
ncbi:MAG: restriction endonuclease subunit S [Candidatus Paceibacterota bacterium]